MSLSITIPFFGENNSGKQVGNTGFAPDLVLASNYWIDNTTLARMKLSGLSHSKKYRIGFFGSISANGWFHGHYTSTYTIGNRTVYLNSWDNSTKIVYIDEVKANESGEVNLDFSTTEASPWGFFGGLIIESYDDISGEVQNVSLIPNIENELAIIESVENNPAMVSSRVYPNPFVDAFNIEFDNKENAENAVVEIFDLSGRLIHSKAFEGIHPGKNNLSIDLSDKILGEGTYFTALKVNGKLLSLSKILKFSK